MTFSIRGNHENQAGNPIPYTRTLSHSWTKSAARYKDWMEYVRIEFLRSFQSARRGSVPVTLDGHLELARGQTAEISLHVTWANGAHGDLDNVLKGVLDSLFVQDKEIVKLTATSEKGKRGSVEGVIIIHDL